MAQAVVFAAENTNTSNSAPVNTVKRWILINIPARSLRPL